MFKQLGKIAASVILFSLSTAHSGETIHTHDEDISFEEHAAHEHGHATAQITFADKILTLNLSLPSMNIFGFEHAATNKEQEKVITQSISTLKNSGSIILIEPNNLCTLTSMNIESDSLNSINTDTHEHHDNHTDEEHSDVSIRQEYLCAKESITSINYTIFNSFPTIEEIEVQYISNISQTLFTATSRQPIQPID